MWQLIDTRQDSGRDWEMEGLNVRENCLNPLLTTPDRLEEIYRNNQQHVLRLLFLLPFAPRLDASQGGSRVMAHLLVRLAERHRLALLYLRAPDEPGLDDRLRERCDWVEEIERPEPGNTLFQKWLYHTQVWISLLRGRPLWAIDRSVKAYAARLHVLAQTWQPDIVQLEFHVMAQYLPALAACPAPRILIEHEPGLAAAREQWQSKEKYGQMVPYLDLHAWKRFEQEIIKQVQAVVVFTERDWQAIAQLGQKTPIVRIPFGVTLPPQPLNPLGDPPLSLLFVGNFQHPPNVDAALRLACAILPQVQKQYPDLRLYLVGDRPPSRLSQIAGERIIVTGWVPDVTPYLDQAALVVAPLRSGGGMRVKVVEALAAGKAVVASPLAVAGLEMAAGAPWVEAESDEEFVEAISRLLAEPDQRAARATQARAWACAHLSWGRVVAAYEALYQSLVEDGGK